MQAGAGEQKGDARLGGPSCLVRRRSSARLARLQPPARRRGAAPGRAGRACKRRVLVFLGGRARWPEAALCRCAFETVASRPLWVIARGIGPTLISTVLRFSSVSSHAALPPLREQPCGLGARAGPRGGAARGAGPCQPGECSRAGQRGRVWAAASRGSAAPVRCAAPAARAPPGARTPPHFRVETSGQPSRGRNGAPVALAHQQRGARRGSATGSPRASSRLFAALAPRSLAPAPRCPQDKVLQDAIKEAEECDGSKSGECAAAWDNVSAGGAARRCALLGLTWSRARTAVVCKQGSRRWPPPAAIKAPASSCSCPLLTIAAPHQTRLQPHRSRRSLPPSPTRRPTR